MLQHHAEMSITCKTGYMYSLIDKTQLSWNELNKDCENCTTEK